MKQFFRIEKAGPATSWSSRLIGTVFLLIQDGEYFVEVQVGSSLLAINKAHGSIILEKDLTPKQCEILNTINSDV